MLSSVGHCIVYTEQSHDTSCRWRDFVGSQTLVKAKWDKQEIEFCQRSYQIRYEKAGMME